MQQSAEPALTISYLSSLPLVHRGKVRDIYQVDEQHLLMVTTDRISAFDVIFPTPIPGKGRILTEISQFWFKFFESLVPHHISPLSLAKVIPDLQERQFLEHRSMVVKKLSALPIEAIVRGYLIGSGWKDYQQSGTVCGIQLPAGLLMAQQLPEPIFTPSTKAEQGDHDENIPFEQMIKIIGSNLAEQVKHLSLSIYQKAAAHALKRGIIIADTKLEFGVDKKNKVYLIDEVLTPDSSRFWSSDKYQIGTSPESFDKQYLRDYLEKIAWNKKPPAPELPPEVVQQTAAKYLEAFKRLCT